MARPHPICYVCGKKHESRQPLTILVTTCERDLIKREAEAMDKCALSAFLRGIFLWYLDPESQREFQEFAQSIASRPSSSPHPVPQPGDPA